MMLPPAGGRACASRQDPYRGPHRPPAREPVRGDRTAPRRTRCSGRPADDPGARGPGARPRRRRKAIVRAAHPCGLDRTRPRRSPGTCSANWRRTGAGGCGSTARRSCPLDLLGDPDHGPGDRRTRSRRTGGVLGAFVYRNEHLPAKLERVFALALRHDLLLDFHVDEGLEPEAQGFDAIVALTARHGLAGRVLCGHACSLAVRPEAEVAPAPRRRGAGGRGADRAAHDQRAICRTRRRAHAAAARASRRCRRRGPPAWRCSSRSTTCATPSIPMVNMICSTSGGSAVLDAHLDPADWIDADHHRVPPAALGLRPTALIASAAPADFLLIDAGSPEDLISRAACAAAGLARGTAPRTPRP